MVRLAALPSPAPPNLQRTLSHEIFEVVPLDIVREIADVDAAILLRRFPDVVHGLFSLNRAVLV